MERARSGLVVAMALLLAACGSDTTRVSPGNTATPATPGTSAVPTTTTAQHTLTVSDLGATSSAALQLDAPTDDGGGVILLPIAVASRNELAGVQFRVTGGTPVGLTGGLSEEAGFRYSVGETSGLVVGFAPEGRSVEAGEGLLTQLEVQPFAEEVCVTEITLVDRAANRLRLDQSFLTCVSVH